MSYAPNALRIAVGLVALIILMALLVVIFICLLVFVVGGVVLAVLAFRGFLFPFNLVGAALGLTLSALGAAASFILARTVFQQHSKPTGPSGQTF